MKNLTKKNRGATISCNLELMRRVSNLCSDGFDNLAALHIEESFESFPDADLFLTTLHDKYVRDPVTYTELRQLVQIIMEH